ncbi:NepR family anti-sigma factor [Methylobacterium planeticum]
MRVLYADVLAQPLPARFETLLADLAARQIIEESS